jgi:ABC-type lipoprotein release transport system permease subunit
LESIYTPVDPTEKDTQLLVSTAGDAENARQRIDDNLAALAPGGVRQMFSLQTIRSQRRVYLRVFGWTAFGLALLALVLTVSGVYGVLAFLVAQRKKEIGIRMALGASARGVVGMVMNQSLRLTVVGLAVGMPIAVGIGRIINAFEPDMDEFFKTYDPVVYLGAATVALAACIAASYIPSRRAAMVDPAITLRHD